MKPSWELILFALVISLAMSLIGGYLAAKHAATMRPAEALRRL
jgi:ABC-type antimicrobial peptide transport system permease subunit